MAGVTELAQQLGESLARTDEYQALKRAISATDDDRELVELRSELSDLESSIQASLRRGEEPDDEMKEAYERVVSRLQGLASYQRLVSAQSNFDKVLNRVNETISKGIQKGGESSIILPS